MVTNSERILIFGGDGEQARRAGTILAQAGYQVSYAHRLSIALRVLSEVSPQLVLIGKDIQDSSLVRVLDAAREALSQQKNAGIVLACASAPGGTDSEKKPAHDAAIPIDFSARELLDTVQMVLQNRDLLEAYHEELQNLKRAHEVLRERFARAVLEGHYLSSDLDRLENELAQLEVEHHTIPDDGRRQALSELAGAISHELNQPLAIIIGRIQLMNRKSEPTQENQQNLAIIEDQAKRMADIIRKIGKIHDYSTKPYIRGHRILDIEKASRDK